MRLERRLESLHQQGVRQCSGSGSVVSEEEAGRLHRVRALPYVLRAPPRRGNLAEVWTAGDANHGDTKSEWDFGQGARTSEASRNTTHKLKTKDSTVGCLHMWACASGGRNPAVAEELHRRRSAVAKGAEDCHASMGLQQPHKHTLTLSLNFLELVKQTVLCYIVPLQLGNRFHRLHLRPRAAENMTMLPKPSQ